MLEIKNLSLSYDQGQSQIKILDGLSFSLKAGQTISVIGQSGCGKTSLLNLIGQNIDKSGGCILYNGEDISLHKKSISHLFQDYGLFPWKKAADNIRLPLILRGDEDKESLYQDLIKKLELENILNLYPSQLSGGQKQRVALARSLISSPELLLLDEAFSAIDPRLKSDIYPYLYSYFKQNMMMVILVSHNIDEALYFGDEILVLPSSAKGRAKIIKNNYKHGQANLDNKSIHEYILKAILGESNEKN